MNKICKVCGRDLDWEDTLDCCGGLLEGYVVERQLWSCEHCGRDYIIELQISVKPEDIEQIYFEEA